MKFSNHLTILTILAISIVTLFYFKPIWTDRLVPFPGNLLVSYFSPWKEESWPGFPTGVPRKGLLGFDTVRMMGPWRNFITNEVKSGRFPSWNPHQFAGAPLLANFQSALFFPPNLIYLILPFSIAWTILVIFQPILATIGMYLLLKNLFHRPPSIIYHLSSIIYHPLLITFLSLAYGFSAWMSVWIEWNIHGFVYALLPFALLFIRKRKTILTILTLSAIVFAGHPQMAFIALTAAALFALVNHGLKFFLLSVSVVFLITSIQWIPAVRYYQEASREQSSSEFIYERTLLPWSQISQLIAPNYLGNPATGNFRGQANFVETTAYSGIALLGFALISLISFLTSFKFPYDSNFFPLTSFKFPFNSLKSLVKAYFKLDFSPLTSLKFLYSPLKAQVSYYQSGLAEKFGLVILGIVILLALPTPVSLLLGRMNLPILSTSVASRWLMLLPLAVTLLAAVGTDKFIELTTSNPTKKARPFPERPGLFSPAIFVFGLIGSLWLAAFFAPPLYRSISIRNLVIPSVIAGLLSFIFFLKQIANSKNNYSLQVADRQSVMKILLFSLAVLSISELILFGWKTMPYTEKRFIYPITPVLAKLQELSRDGSRFAATDGSVIESNFATYYGLYDLSGYDALYPRRIGELVWTANNNGIPVKDFSRSTVVVPEKPSEARNNLWNLAGIRWIINKDDMLAEHPGRRSNDLSSDFKLIWEEGKWQIYENTKVYPRAFFATDLVSPIIPTALITPISPAEITSYKSNKVEISVSAPADGYLILTDTFYPGWKALVDGTAVTILPAFGAFRAVEVSKGSHTVRFNL